MEQEEQPSTLLALQHSAEPVRGASLFLTFRQDDVPVSHEPSYVPSRGNLALIPLPADPDRALKDLSEELVYFRRTHRPLILFRAIDLHVWIGSKQLQGRVDVSRRNGIVEPIQHGQNLSPD